MKFSRDKLKPVGGLILNGGIYSLATAATAGTAPLLQGGVSVIAGLVSAITGNLASNHACVINNLSYNALIKRFGNTDPETINHDLERIFRQSSVLSLEFIKTLFLKKIQDDERLVSLTKDEQQFFFNGLKTFFDENIDDLKNVIEGDTASVSKSTISDPGAYLSNIVAQIFRMTSVQFDEVTETSLKKFYAERLPSCFELAFKEALKSDDKGFKAFQIWILEDIRTQNEGISKVQQEILQLINNISVQNKDFISRGEMEQLADELAEKIYNRLEENLAGIKVELKRLQKIEVVVDSTYKAIIANSAAIEILTAKLDSAVSQRSEEIINRSEQVEELAKKIGLLQAKKEEAFQKQIKRKNDSEASPGDEDKKELYDAAYGRWLTTSQELETAEKQLSDVKQFVAEAYVLLYKKEEESIVSETTKQARAFFEAGDFEKVKELLSSQQREIEREQLLKKDETLQQQKKDFALGDLLNARTILIDFTDPDRFSKAADYFKKSIHIFPCYDNNFEFAHYLANQNQHQLAVQFYQQAISYAGSEGEKAAIKNNLSILYKDIQEFEQAESAYREALEIYKKLAQNNPAAYEPYVAMTLNNLGNLYGSIQQFEPAENAYSEALEIRRKLVQNNTAAYEPDVADTLNNLGVLYHSIQQFEPAESALREALEIRRRLAQNNTAAYEPDVADTLNNLGILYRSIQQFEPAESTYSEALEIFKKLAQNNPAAYEPYVAGTLNNLGILYRSIQQFEPAESAYSEALGIYKKLAQNNPAAYEPYVAGTSNNLGNLYCSIQKFEPAERNGREALEIYKKLAQNNPTAYEPHVAGTLNNLGFLYRSIQRFEPAESAYSEALEIRRRLAQKNPAAYEPDVAGTLNNLGILYETIQRFEPAKSAYSEALEIKKRYIKNKNAWKEVDWLYLLLASTYKKMGKNEEVVEAVKWAWVVVHLFCSKQEDEKFFFDLGAKILTSYEINIELFWNEAKQIAGEIRNLQPDDDFATFLKLP